MSTIRREGESNCTKRLTANQATETAIERVRQAARDQLGTDAPDLRVANVGEVTRFSAQLPQQYTDQERSALAAQVHELRPWFQGPFYLGGDVVIGGAWRNDLRWKLLAAELPPSLSGSASSTSAATPATTASPSINSVPPSPSASTRRSSSSRHTS